MLIDLLYKHGLGDLLVSHEINGEQKLCNIVYDSGKLVLKNQNHIRLKADTGTSDIKHDLLGVITKAENEEWKGMTFLGLSHCNYDIPSNTDYVNKIMNIGNQYGDRLVDFKGSIYRAYQLALDNDILPIVSMNAIRIKSGKYGMAVYNFSVDGYTAKEKSNIFLVLRNAIEKKLTYSLDELNLPEESFTDLFGRYVNDVA